MVAGGDARIPAPAVAVPAAAAADRTEQAAPCGRPDPASSRRAVFEANVGKHVELRAACVPNQRSPALNQNLVLDHGDYVGERVMRPVLNKVQEGLDEAGEVGGPRLAAMERRIIAGLQNPRLVSARGQDCPTSERTAVNPLRFPSTCTPYPVSSSGDNASGSGRCTTYGTFWRPTVHSADWRRMAGSMTR